MSSVLPLYANDEVRDATLRDLIFEIALMISSAIPSVKYSFSASALMFVNGRTAIDLTTCAPSGTGVVVGVVTVLTTRALANSPEVEKRAAASRDSAFDRARSISSGTPSRTLLSDGTGCVKRLVSTACAVGPVKGLSPVSI